MPKFTQDRKSAFGAVLAVLTSATVFGGFSAFAA